MKTRWLLFPVIMIAVVPCLAYAQPTPISACGITITTSGSYVVTANLTNSTTSPCITVKAYPVSIDLAGFTIKSSNGKSSGIYGAQNYLSVSNGTIRYFHIGINAPGDNGVKLDKVRVTDCGQGGWCHPRRLRRGE